MTVTNHPAPQVNPASQRRRADTEHTPDDWNYWHIVGWWEHWTTKLLRRVPRALCGVRLDGAPDMPEPAEDCPACVERNGGDALGH